MQPSINDIIKVYTSCQFLLDTDGRSLFIMLLGLVFIKLSLEKVLSHEQLVTGIFVIF